MATLTPELQEKEVSSRISRQRPVLRVSSELALVGIIGEDKKSGGEWIIKVTKELVREIQNFVDTVPKVYHSSLTIRHCLQYHS